MLIRHAKSIKDNTQNSEINTFTNRVGKVFCPIYISLGLNISKTLALDTTGYNNIALSNGSPVFDYLSHYIFGEKGFRRVGLITAAPGLDTVKNRDQILKMFIIIPNKRIIEYLRVTQ